MTLRRRLRHNTGHVRPYAPSWRACRATPASGHVGAARSRHGPRRLRLSPSRASGLDPSGRCAMDRWRAASRPHATRPRSASGLHPSVRCAMDRWRLRLSPSRASGLDPSGRRAMGRWRAASRPHATRPRSASGHGRASPIGLVEPSSSGLSSFTAAVERRGSCGLMHPASWRKIESRPLAPRHFPNTTVPDTDGYTV